MKIAVFTSEEIRHRFLVNILSLNFDRITNFIISKSNFQNGNSIMNLYNSFLQSWQKKIFGEIDFKVKPNFYSRDELMNFNLEDLKDSIDSDLFILFGIDFINLELKNFLLTKNTIYLHMGVSPYYIGGPSNFWAMYDRRPEYVGGTIQTYSLLKDSGDIICNVIPEIKEYEPFEIGMYSVKITILKLLEILNNFSYYYSKRQKQDETKCIRNAKDNEYNTTVLKDYLKNLLSPREIREKLEYRVLSNYILV